MEFARLIKALSDPAAYRRPVEAVEVRQTHISAVFLTGSDAYKIKKPVNFGFLDFSTLEKRRHFCEEEVRLNRRLAATVYRGVVPITQNGEQLHVEGQGDVIEWAVKMERLPDDAALERCLQRGEVTDEFIQALARKVAGFHAHAETGEHVSAFGRFDVVAGNVRENFEQTAHHAESIIGRSVFERLRTLTEKALESLHPLIDGRARRGIPRDTHGDLRADHVYICPKADRPADAVIIDCIEFNERFRFADPVSDMAFLVMDLRFRARPDLADAFADSYFQHAGDEEGRALLQFYTAYRAVVRAKVEGMKLSEEEMPQAERALALQQARTHWLLALAALEKPGMRPCLILMGGLPGTGKSTIARRLRERANFNIIRSDAIRKEVAGVTGVVLPKSAFGEGIYSPAWTERTYAECLRRAEQLLFDGNRVIVDASFSDEKRRCQFLAEADRWGVPGIFVHCLAPSEIVRERIEKRLGDVSDADWAIHQKVAKHWDDTGQRTRRTTVQVSTAGTPEQTLNTLIPALSRFNL